MARMIPPEYQDINNSQAERHLYYSLNKSFDDHWTIFHSYSFESRNKENKIIDSEIDFLLVNQEFGILVLEVKGGLVNLIDGVWFQNSKKIDDPINQARVNKYKIETHLKKYLHSSELPVPIGYAICFPDIFGKINNLTKGLETIIVTGESIKYLAEAIQLIMRQQKKPDYLIDQVMFRTIEKALMPIFEYGSGFIHKFGQEDRIIFTLTEEQCHLLSFISEYKKALIKGCAGSGKTVMALKKAKYLAAEGNHVLLLCFNILLAEYLALETKNYPNIVSKTYHNFCGSELYKAGINTEDISDPKEFFQKELPEKFLGLIAEHPIKYDAVIVDEGQDFREEYWYTINELVEEDGYYYIFYDPDQNIFRSELKLPELGIPFVLNKNCRNTRKIFEELKTLASMNIEIDNKNPEGSEIFRYTINNKLQLRNKLTQILEELVFNKKVNENQIIIIGTHQLRHTSLGNAEKLGRFTISENGPAGKYIIPYYSCMKYKGLESDVVILLDYQDERWQNSAICYTAISRAKHILYTLKC